MIDVNLPMEWEDGTPVTTFRLAVERSFYVQGVLDQSLKGKPTGYYTYETGGYDGSEDHYQRIRNVYNADDYKDDLS